MASIDQLNDIYRDALGRDVDASGIASYSGMDVRDVWDAVLGSQEYKNRTIQAKVDAGASGYDNWIAEGNTTSTEFKSSSAGDIVAVDPNQIMGSEYKHIGYSNGRKLYVDEGDGGDSGMFGGWGATIGAVVGGAIAAYFTAGTGTAAGSAAGAAIMGGAEEYEKNHDWGDALQEAGYSGVKGYIGGYAAGIGNVGYAAAVGGVGNALVTKAEGGDWSNAAKSGAIAGAMAGAASWSQNGGAWEKTGGVDWTAGGTYGTGYGMWGSRFNTAPVGSVAQQASIAGRSNISQTSGITADGYTTGASQVAGSSTTGSVTDAVAKTGMASRYGGGTQMPTTKVSSSGMMTNRLMSGSSESSLAQASALSSGEGASSGLFGTGYNAMELLTGASIAVQGVGTVMNYINQEDELSPEEEADRQIRYWNALANAGYGSSVPGSDSTTPTTPGSVYKSGSITKG